MMIVVATSGTCVPGVQSMNDTSGGGSDTERCWWMANRIYIGRISPPSRVVMLQSFVLLTFISL